MAPSTEWLERCTRSDYEPVFLVELTNGVWSYKATKGRSSLGYPEAMLAVDPMVVEHNPFTRAMKGSAIRVVFEDGWIRPIVANVDLKHKKCIVTVGAADLPEVDFEPYFPSGVIDEFGRVGGAMVFEIEDIFAILQKTKIVGQWFGNPLTAIEDILLNKVGLPAGLVESVSLDPTQYADIGHLNMGRGVGPTTWGVNNGVTKPTSSAALVQGLAQLMNGQMVIDGDGKIAFHRFDATASIVDTWGSDEILKGSFGQLGDASRIINRIVFGFGHDVDGSDKAHYHANETVSQAARAYNGMADRILSDELDTNWINYPGIVVNAIDDADLTIRLGGPIFCWSGARKKLGVAQAANSDCTGARPVYLMITSTGRGPEIVKCTAISFTIAEAPVGSGAPVYTDNLTNEFVEGDEHHFVADFTVVRAQRGTLAKAWGPGNTQGTYVFDITPLVLLGDELFARYATGTGVHVFRLKTLWDRIEVVPTDFVGVNWPEFLAYGLDGLTDAIKCQILGKAIVPARGGSKSHIQWTLATVQTDSITTTGGVVGLLEDGLRASEDNALLHAANVVASHVDGFDFSDDGGRTGSFAAGIGAIGGKASIHPAKATRTFEANAITWVAHNLHTNLLEFHVAAVEPTWAPHQVAQIAITCNAGDITGTVDLRVSTAMNGERLHDETVDTLQMTDDAVTVVKVLDGAIGSSKMWADSRSATHNFDFSIYED